ncbi:DNA polymerase Y family protein [Siphonobacter curvatus]|uniref:DNA polymerase IV n=1 Tax=Siphonobacter curvatus TaxID=2094562 RepID=A0A2S7ILD1_9BACT|nr:DNA polymerase IV [Siphonobacter curvatus]PQA58449.1 DNA polymerase IV [Siphonobacter curvatus]
MNEFSIPPGAAVLFVDMNSFFASCEQQDNFYLRGRPVAVCVYTGEYGCVIAPSIEAKKRGIKLGMRLNEAVRLCPELVPLTTTPDKYRDYHTKIMQILRRFSDQVIPRSIDEAIVILSNHRLIYHDLEPVARAIKKAIHQEVGDYLQCSIGIAPNAFLAKLGSDLIKPNGLTVISPGNIDLILSQLELTDLPGIGHGMAQRLQKAGIETPLQLRYADPEFLRAACRSIVGWHWHLRLNFYEVDTEYTSAYKSMQAMRQLSRSQRRSPEILQQILFMLCQTLERRTVQQSVFCKTAHFWAKYEEGRTYQDDMQFQTPVQDGVALFNLVLKRAQTKAQWNHSSESLFNSGLVALGIGVHQFIPDQLVQYQLFEDNVRKDKLRKVYYELRDKHGSRKVMRGAEVSENPPLQDVIGFGSVKDLYGRITPDWMSE